MLKVWSVLNSEMNQCCIDVSNGMGSESAWSLCKKVTK
jgi:hypothetical protein